MSKRNRHARHVQPRADLHRSIWLAGYYRWCALRHHPAPGVHPLYSDALTAYRIEDRALSAAVHKATARFYLAKAAKLQASGAWLVP